MPTFRELGGDVLIAVDIGSDGEVTKIFLNTEAADEAAVEVAQIAGNLNNIEHPLFAAQRIARDDMQAHFDSESDPDGNKWTPLDEEYLTYKTSEGYPENILRRSGDLEDAATSAASWIVDGDTLFFRTGGLPEYGEWHQTGTGEESNWGFAGDVRERLRNAPQAGESGHDAVGIGRGKALPRRAFIGLSEPAEMAIWQIFDTWFDESTNLSINPKTGIAQLRGPGGKFGRRLV